MPERNIEGRTNPRYAIGRAVPYPFDEADRRVREVLAEEGFGILTEADLDRTLRQKLGVEIPRQRILGACNPPLAHRALEAEPSIGLLLPCNVVLRETDDPGTTWVEAIDPVVQMEVSAHPGLPEVAGEVRRRLVRAIDRLGV